jgi:hypothetical protein
MLHATLHLAKLDADGVTIPLRHADLLVVARAESAELDWEVVAHSIDQHAVAPGHHDLAMTCIHPAGDGGSLEIVDLHGSAFLVRAVENALVFRGAGPIEGFDLELLVS